MALAHLQVLSLFPHAPLELSLFLQGTEPQLHYFADPKKIRTTSLDPGIMVSFATSRGLIHPSPVMTTQGKKRVDLKMMSHILIEMVGQT